MKSSKMLLGVNDKPPLLKWILLSLQHVFAMFGATILVPILVNKAVGSDVLSIPVALISSGIGTLIYIICTKGKSPVYLGSSFAFITPMIVAFAKCGKASVFTGIMAVGLVYVLVALIIKLVGKNWINKLLPPIVVGPMIMIIGLSLAPTAIEEIGLNLEKVPWKNIVVALISFLTTGVLAVRGKGFLKVIPFLLGMVAGYISSIILGMVNLKEIFETSFIAVPDFYVPFVHYKLNFAGILTIVPIALVTISEHIGDHKVLSEIIDKDLITDPGLDNTLMGDGMATFAAGLIGGPANTTYGENTSVVGMTKVASVWVIGLAAIIAIIFGFLGQLTAIISSIPSPVLGGVSILLYGFISVNGLKILIQNKADFENTKNVIVASSMLVLGLGGAAISIITKNISVSISGMSLAALVGILLNLFIKESK
ncbi:MAG: NCS2 family nucleobase:cation symporter [Tenericutes bacterium]|nr:NCS2 family nucleobase:cation symporter [Mycoplasmatota bacterium]